MRMPTRYDCVIAMQDLAFGNCISIQVPATDSSSLFDYDEEWLLTEKVIKHERHELTCEINTIGPFRVSCNSVLDTFHVFLAKR